MNILFIQAQSEWTPMTAVHADLLRNLERLGVKCHFACAAGSPDQPGVLERLANEGRRNLLAFQMLPSIHAHRGINLVREMLRLPEGLFALVSHVVRHRIDVIHVANHARDLATAALVARATATPLVVHLHGRHVPWPWRLLEASFRHADAIIAVSEYVAGTARSSGVAPFRLRVVPNAIDLQRVRPTKSRADIRAELDITYEAPIVITIGRLIPWKGQDRVISAFSQVLPRFPTAQLLIVGAVQDTHRDSASYFEQLRVQVASLGIAQAVKFLGNRSDVASLLAASDLYAMGSRDEPFGLVYLEAMATSLPVVAERSGGTPEVVVDGETGILVPPDDSVAFATALLRLMDEPDTRRKLGDAGRRRAEQFSPSRSAELALDVYRSVKRERGELANSP